MKWWLTLCLIWGASTPSALAQQSAVKTPPTVAKIYYFPFEGHKMQGITESNIERSVLYQIRIVQGHPRYSYLVGEHPILSKLKKTLMATPGAKPLGIGSLRLKVKMPAETLLADANGRVQRVETGELFQLSRQQMEEIGSDIESLAGVVDMLSIQYTENKLKK